MCGWGRGRRGCTTRLAKHLPKPKTIFLVIKNRQPYMGCVKFVSQGCALLCLKAVCLPGMSFPQSMPSIKNVAQILGHPGAQANFGPVLVVNATHHARNDRYVLEDSDGGQTAAIVFQNRNGVGGKMRVGWCTTYHRQPTTAFHKLIAPPTFSVVPNIAQRLGRVPCLQATK